MRSQTTPDQLEHHAMRLTWFRTFFWFIVLGLILAGVAWVHGGIAYGGVLGVIMLALMVLAAVFSSKITPAIVKAYDPVPGDPFGDRAINVANTAWARFIAGVKRSPFGEAKVKLMKQPTIKLASNPGPNAFCTGWNWQHSVVVLFDSLFVAFDWANEKYYGLSPEDAKKLSDRQVVSVLEHEFGHYYHRDVAISATAGLLNSLIAWTAGAIVEGVLIKWVVHVPVLRNVVLFVLEQIVWRFVNSVMRLPQAAISRQRETGADIVSAEFSENPCLLATGLGNLEAYVKEVLLPKEKAHRVSLADNKAAFYHHAIREAIEGAVMDALGICMFMHPVNLAAAPNARKSGWWARLTADHPATKDRVEMAETFNQGSCNLAPPVVADINS